MPLSNASARAYTLFHMHYNRFLSLACEREEQHTAEDITKHKEKSWSENVHVHDVNVLVLYSSASHGDAGILNRKRKDSEAHTLEPRV